MSKIKDWKCRLCGGYWPAYSQTEAWLTRARANDIHPHQDCQPPDESQ